MTLYRWKPHYTYIHHIADGDLLLAILAVLLHIYKNIRGIFLKIQVRELVACIGFAGTKSLEELDKTKTKKYKIKRDQETRSGYLD